MYCSRLRVSNTTYQIIAAVAVARAKTKVVIAM